jgi:hypothetical protein
MTPYQQHLLETLVEIFPEVFDRVHPPETIQPSRCIMTTKVGRAVLDYFGIASRPVAVDIVVANRRWQDWFVSHATEPPPEGAWAVGAVKHPDGPSGNGWDGHLLLEVEGDSLQLLDLDFQQFARPTKNIITPPTLLLPLESADLLERYHQKRPVVWSDEHSGVTIRLQRTERTDWRTAADWKRHGHQELIGTLIRQLRDLALMFPQQETRAAP